MSRTVKEIRHAYANLFRQVSTAETLTERGFEPPSIYELTASEKFAWLFRSDTRAVLAKAIEEETDLRERESLRRLLYELEEQYVSLGALRLEDEVSLIEYKTILRVDGTPVNYRDVPYIFATEPTHERRELVAASAHRYWSRRLAPRARRALRSMHARIARLGVAHTVDYYQQRMNIPLWQLRDVARVLLRVTQQPYEEHVLPYLRRRFKGGLRQWGMHNLWYVYAMQNLNGMVDINPEKHTSRWIEGYLGLEMRSLRGLKLIDLDERPKKSARPMCIPVDSPNRVNLLIRPYWTFDDEGTSLHEWFHVLQYCYASAHFSFEMRNLSRNAGVAETFAFLAECCLQEPQFVQWYFKVDSATAHRIAYTMLIVGLLRLRVLCANLEFQFHYFTHPFDELANQRAYKRLMQHAQPFGVQASRYLDIAWDWESVGYLLAWLSYPRFRAYMRAKFGPRWFKQRAVGLELKKLWRPGESLSIFDLAYGWRSSPWDWRPVLAVFQGMGEIAEKAKA